MAEYRRILVVVDLTEDSLPIGRRAHAIASAVGAEMATIMATPASTVFSTIS